MTSDPGLLGSLGVRAGELVLDFLAGDAAELRDDLRAGEPLVKNGGREVKSSSDFFLPVLVRGVSNELDLDVGLLYRLEVDLAFVIPDLAPNFREEPGPDPASKSFLVCLTISGAGSSLSLTPNRTPVEALLEGSVLAPAAALTPPLAAGFVLLTAALGLGLGGDWGCLFFSAMTIESLTSAGFWLRTPWTRGVSRSRGGRGGGLSQGGGAASSRENGSMGEAAGAACDRTSTDCALFIDSRLLLLVV